METSTVVKSVPVSEVWDGYTYFRRQDVLIAKITPCFENGKGAYWGELETVVGFGTTEFIVLRAAGPVVPRYLYHITMISVFRIHGAEAMTGAAGQKRVPLNFVRNFVLGLPPGEEQQQILDFIDDESARINTTIQRTQRQIDLIREYRTRLIADVVTGKVDVRGIPVEAVPEDLSAVTSTAQAGDALEEFV